MCVPVSTMIQALDVRARPLNERIRWARQQAGYSQERFAELVGTSRRHVMRWERPGGTRPRVEFARRIADVTGQPLELFAADDDEGSG